VRLTIRAFGRPAPQGSKRLGGAGQMIEQSPYLPAWRTAIRAGAYKAYKAAGIAHDTLPVFGQGIPVRVVVTFLLAQGQLPTGAPDVDKLLRAVLDALGGGRIQTARLFHDDSQVVQLAGHKKSAGTVRPGAIIIATDEDV
jgi:Holliday junction resolvase RusA-like endonuclease